MRKIILASITLAMGIGLLIGTSGAYFNFIGQTNELILMAGTLELELTNTTSQNLANWQPGEVKQLEFSLMNIGTMPLYAKAYLSGAWDLEGFDPSLVEIVSIERLTEGGSWETMTALPTQLDGEFMIGVDSETPAVIESDETISLRLHVRLSDEATSEYQDRRLMAVLHVAAKQINQGAPWPAEY